MVWPGDSISTDSQGNFQTTHANSTGFTCRLAASHIASFMLLLSIDEHEHITLSMQIYILKFRNKACGIDLSQLSIFRNSPPPNSD